MTQAITPNAVNNGEGFKLDGTEGKKGFCHDRNSDQSLNVPRGEEREAESGRQVNYLSVAHWPDQ